MYRIIQYTCALVFTILLLMITAQIANAVLRKVGQLDWVAGEGVEEDFGALVPWWVRTFVGLGVVGARLLYFVFGAGIRVAEEKGLVPLFTERCSASTSAGIGVGFGTNMPTCRITLYS